MVIPYVSTGPASSSAQNALIDEVNALRALIETPDPFVRKTVSDPIANSTTVINDSEMFLTLPDGLWLIRAHMSATGPAAADIKFVWALTGGAAQATARHCRGPATGTAGVDDSNMRSSVHNWSSTIPYGTDGTLITSVSETGCIEVTGGTGTMQLQFAQGTANAGTTSLTTHSWIHARRVGD